LLGAQDHKLQQRIDQDDSFKKTKHAKEEDQKIKIEQPTKKQVEEQKPVVQLPNRREVEPGVFRTVEEADEILKKFDMNAK
jgi:hypothetical protein